MPATEPASELKVLREPLREAGGEQVLTGLRAALAWLESNQQEINDLNVFPVPDGDTGSNMYLTMRSAVEEAKHAPHPESAESVVAAAAHGSLMGARGNSGVILSQIFRGLAQGMTGYPRVNAEAVARALGEASAVAYRAVMKPTEGTILTVIREAAESARAAATETDDIRVLLDRVVRDSHAAVERTIDQLAVLREAGVVDAGGYGLAVIIEGFSRALSETDFKVPPVAITTRRPGEPAMHVPYAEQQAEAALSVPGRRGAAAVAAKEDGWGYCTEFMVGGPGLDIDALREELATLGESALVVGDSDLARVHIHTRDPAPLIAAAAARGRLSKLKVEDMSAQHHEVLQRAGAAEAAAAPPKALAVVTVAPAPGFRDILSGLGADQVVLGGQTMNPSIEDLLNAVRATNAKQAILLPNNGNVILTAEQVDALSEDCDVRVVPTLSLPQGISALLAFDSTADLDTNVERMVAAMHAVRGVEITRAVRASGADGKEIREGDVIGIVDGKITQVGSDYLPVIEGVLDAQPQAPELVTVYRGGEVTEPEAQAVVDALRGRYPNTEFELHVGGQDLYPYVLSLE